LANAIKIGTQRIVGEVLFPEAGRQQVHLKGRMSVDSLEHEFLLFRYF